VCRSCSIEAADDARHEPSRSRSIILSVNQDLRLSWPLGRPNRSASPPERRPVEQRFLSRIWSKIEYHDPNLGYRHTRNRFLNNHYTKPFPYVQHVTPTTLTSGSGDTISTPAAWTVATIRLDFAHGNASTWANTARIPAPGGSTVEQRNLHFVLFSFTTTLPCILLDRASGACQKEVGGGE
jgi:hypothetical protein